MCKTDESENIKLAKEIADAAQVSIARAQYFLELSVNHKESIEWEKSEQSTFDKALNFLNDNE